MKPAIIGAGGIGGVHARHAARIPGVETMVFDRHHEKAQSLAQNFGLVACEEFERILDWAEAAVVCTPTDVHAEVSTSFLDLGKSVLVEKPISISIESAQKMADLAVSKGAKLAVAQVVRFFPEHAKVAAEVKNGGVSIPALARLRRVGGKPRNYHGWFHDESRSGGVLVDLAIHDFDWIRWVLGDVTRVFSTSAKANNPSLEGDYALTTLKTKSGAIAHVEASWLDRGFRTSIEVSGQGGTIEFDSRSHPTFRLETEDKRVTQSPNAASVDPYGLQLRAFLAELQGEKTDLATAEDGIEALRIALAALESARTGEPVVLS